jgi:hypothetical protein
LIQRAKLLELKVKLIPHTNFMAAPKIPRKKRTCSLFWLFGIAIHRVKVCKKRYVKNT